MAVGSLSGPNIDSSSFMPVMPNTNATFDPSSMVNPNPTLSSPFPTNAQSWDVAMTPSNMGMGIDWSQTPQTLQSQFAATGGDTGLALGSGSGAMIGEGGGQENSDEYWNALIDGKYNLCVC